VWRNCKYDTQDVAVTVRARDVSAGWPPAASDPGRFSGRFTDGDELFRDHRARRRRNCKYDTQDVAVTVRARDVSAGWPPAASDPGRFSGRFTDGDELFRDHRARRRRNHQLSQNTS
jgi:hypothetical protein